jgi:cytochrome c oxidase subunit 2
LFWLITIIIGVWFIAAEAMFFWLMWRFRKKPGVPSQYVTGKEKHLKRWINIPHALVLVCDVFIVIGAIQVWYNIKIRMPETDTSVRIIGQQWAWVFQYPGPDGKLDTADDLFTSDDLYVQKDKTYHYELRSRDVLHDFSVPAFRLKQDAIPGRTIEGWFRPTQSGTFDIQCAEICGIGHGVMAGRIHVQDASQYAAWAAGAHTATDQ